MPNPLIFLYVKLFSPQFIAQTKCQYLCKACSLLIQTFPLFPVLMYSTLLLRNVTQSLKFPCLKWLLGTQLSMGSNLVTFEKSHPHWDSLLTVY